MDEKYYSYFFTRQDISPEQQLVQTAHAAFKLGSCMEKNIPGEGLTAEKKSGRRVITKKTNPDETYFTVVGVRDVPALEATISILKEFGYAHEVFYEPDIGNEPTSIAVYPIHEIDRGALMAFNLLKMRDSG